MRAIASPAPRTAAQTALRPTTVFAGVIALAALSALGACAPTTGASSALTASGAASGAPRPVAGYDWFLNDDPDEPRLSYGLAESDDVPLSLMCAKGSGKIALSLIADQTPDRAITVESGGAVETYRARVELSDMNDGVYLVASAPASDPVFQRFRSVGWLAVLQGDQRMAMAAQPGSEKRAARFLDLCR